ncbi:zinc finger protein 107 [Drosophila erecta]|uniref:Uncharacterized protein n=1 Tax=Drosophila erecta TaxID=7220 RepID=B3NWS1_DROER|nr:zinc finger protein 107 [Drosophila erecta]EDV47233.1 uncharacterized protein Dere_GG19520 [Drosophila erecta]
MESSICRVCLEQKENMLNVFLATPVSGISIASMISQWSGYPVMPQDPFPKTICQRCVQDAHNAYEMDYAPKDSVKEELVEEKEEKEANEGERANQFDIQLKEEIIDDSQSALEPTDDLCRFWGDSHDNQVPPHVMNEPLVENDENDCPNSNRKLEQETRNFETQQKPKNNKNKKEMEMIKCPECPKLLPRKRLEQHAVTQQDSRPFECPICGKAYKLSSHLKAHSWVHLTGDRPYKCSQCPKSFTLKSNLRRHEKLHKTEPKVRVRKLK